MKKYNKEIKTASFEDVYNWLVALNATEHCPVLIAKYGGRSISPFRTYIEKNNIILRSCVQDSIQQKYVLTKKKWDAFCNYVTIHPDMCRGELANNYKQYECTNKTFWPSIISICKSYYNK